MTHEIGDIPWATEWNGDGSMLAAITKKKVMHILDPRQTASAQVTPAHGGIKA